MHGFPLAFPLALEVGLRIEERTILSVGGPGERIKLTSIDLKGFHFLTDPFKVFRVIGFKEKFTIGGECFFEDG